jgi:methylsterol monooxygenase
MACVEDAAAKLAAEPATPTREEKLKEEDNTTQVEQEAICAEQQLAEQIQTQTPAQKQLGALMVILRAPGAKLTMFYEQLLARIQDRLSENPSLQKHLAALVFLLQRPGVMFAESFERLKARYSATTLLLLVTTGLQIVASNLTGLPIMAIERYAPHWIARYKIQPKTYQPTRRIVEMLTDVWGLQLAGVIISAALTKLKIPALDRLAERSVNAPLPSFPRILGELGFNLVSWEVVFYTLHRLFHTQRFYKRVHKKHHVFKAPVALCAAYATNVEHIFGDLLPGMIGSVLLGTFANSNVVNIWIWTAFGMVLTGINHSGYYFPWFPFKECTMMHDYHHHSFYSQLGLFGWMDRLFGTDGGADYVQWRAEALRRILGTSRGA